MCGHSSTEPCAHEKDWEQGKRKESLLLKFRVTVVMDLKVAPSSNVETLTPRVGAGTCGRRFSHQGRDFVNGLARREMSVLLPLSLTCEARMRSQLSVTQ